MCLRDQGLVCKGELSQLTNSMGGVVVQISYILLSEKLGPSGQEVIREIAG